MVAVGANIQPGYDAANIQPGYGAANIQPGYGAVGQQPQMEGAAVVHSGYYEAGAGQPVAAGGYAVAGPGAVVGGGVNQQLAVQPGGGYAPVANIPAQGG
jgi:hypothetical protein